MKSLLHTSDPTAVSAGDLKRTQPNRSPHLARHDPNAPDFDCRRELFEPTLSFDGPDTVHGASDTLSAAPEACCRLCAADPQCTHWEWSAARCSLRRGRLRRPAVQAGPPPTARRVALDLYLERLGATDEPADGRGLARLQPRPAPCRFSAEDAPFMVFSSARSAHES